MEWEGQAEEPPCEGRLAGGVICEGPRDGVEPDRRGRLDFQHIHASQRKVQVRRFLHGNMSFYQRETLFHALQLEETVFVVVNY